jgi:hypothetical protein
MQRTIGGSFSAGLFLARYPVGPVLGLRVFRWRSSFWKPLAVFHRGDLPADFVGY